MPSFLDAMKPERSTYACYAIYPLLDFYAILIGKSPNPDPDDVGVVCEH
jgi:hypothetical protein